MPKEATKTRKSKKVDGGKRKKGESTRRSIAATRACPLLTRAPDPNAPKRGLSAYMFFANDNREKVREDNPGIKFGLFAPRRRLSSKLTVCPRRGWQAPR